MDIPLEKKGHDKSLPNVEWIFFQTVNKGESELQLLFIPKRIREGSSTLLFVSYSLKSISD